jgi:hypothetical protein
MDRLAGTRFSGSICKTSLSLSRELLPPQNTGGCFISVCAWKLPTVPPKRGKEKADRGEGEEKRGRRGGREEEREGHERRGGEKRRGGRGRSGGEKGKGKRGDERKGKERRETEGERGGERWMEERRGRGGKERRDCPVLHAHPTVPFLSGHPWRWVQACLQACGAPEASGSEAEEGGRGRAEQKTRGKRREAEERGRRRPRRRAKGAERGRGKEERRGDSSEGRGEGKERNAERRTRCGKEEEGEQGGRAEEGVSRAEGQGVKWLCPYFHAEL